MTLSTTWEIILIISIILLLSFGIFLFVRSKKIFQFIEPPKNENVLTKEEIEEKMRQVLDYDG